MNKKYATKGYSVPAKGHQKIIIKDYNSEHDSKNVKRSSYLISIMNKDILIKFGAIKHSENILYKVYDYDELDTNQKCAIIGISRDYLTYIFDDSQNNILINFIKTCEDFKDITGISNIDKSGVERVLHNFISNFNQVSSNDCIIFNIEPAGKGKLKRIYPSAKLTIPGGSMETIDTYSFEECALREFREETHIEITDYTVIKNIKIKNIGRNGGSRFTHFSSAPKPSGPSILYISMYYMVRTNIAKYDL